MRILTNKSTIQKIAIIVLLVILFSFATPATANAEFNPGKIFAPFMDLFRALGDVFLGALQKFMVGTEKAYGSLMIDSDDPNVARMQEEADVHPR